MAILTTLIMLVVFVVGGALLQIFLSKRESRWPGLILPSITLLYSIAMVFSIAVFDGMGGGEVFMTIASTFVLGNIPTAVLLGIYFGCRRKQKSADRLNKMKIQDLGE